MDAGFEQSLGKHLFTPQSKDKSHTDKLLSRKEVSEIQVLMKKDDLTRSELLEMLYLLSSSEIKLANFGEWDRYLLGKFLTWIRDFVSLAEILYDYKGKYEKYASQEIKKEDYKTEQEHKKAFKSKENAKEVKELMENNRKFVLHNIKFLVDIYLYLARSTLSITMAGFDTLSKNKFEYVYPPEGITPKEEKPQSSFGKISLG